MSRLEFLTPPPVSSNHMYRPGGYGRRILTDAAMTYKAEVRIAVRDALARTYDWRPCDTYVFTLRIWFADNRRADLDNAAKLTIDATAEAVGFDDRYIRRLIIERGGIDKSNPRGLVILEEYQP